MTVSKNDAYDGKGAVAGNISSDPEQDTVDELTAQAGLDLSEGEAVGTQSKLQERDANRWELDPDSKQSGLK
ncbi:MAG: DUF6335 family protein [Cyanobacteria bacterium J06636_16]